MADAKNIKSKILPIYKKPVGLGLLLILLVPFWFAGDLKAASSDVSVKVCHPPTAPTITSPQDGMQTSESSVILSGSANPNSVVYAYRNSEPMGFVTSGNDGSFSISIGLNLGNNGLTAGSKNECNDTALSNIVTVERLETSIPPSSTNPKSNPSPPTPTKKPSGLTTTGEGPSSNQETSEQAPTLKPKILAPKNGIRVTRPSILVKGLTLPLTKVRLLLNNQQVAEVLSDDRGKFIVSITLERGKNNIMASIDQASGPINSDPVIVTYEPGLLTTAKSTPIVPIILIVLLELLILLGYLMSQTKSGKRLWLSIKPHKRDTK